MNMSETFQRIILPYLIEVSEKSGSRGGLLFVSLYGSANYSCYGDILSPREDSSEEQDYDIWIVFKKGYADEAKRFATTLFGTSFLLVEEEASFILYDKLHWLSPQGKFLIAPIITVEGVYESLPSGANPVLVPWYRPRERGRAPVVPVRNAYSDWQHFDMRQKYVPSIGLWQLMMPLSLPMAEGLGLGTFIEGSITGRLFYGNPAEYHRLMNCLLGWFIKEAQLDSFSKVAASELLYQMLTVSSKAGKNFKSLKLEEISHWISK